MVLSWISVQLKYSFFSSRSCKLGCKGRSQKSRVVTSLVSAFVRVLLISEFGSRVCFLKRFPPPLLPLDEDPPERLLLNLEEEELDFEFWKLPVLFLLDVFLLLGFLMECIYKSQIQFWKLKFISFQYQICTIKDCKRGETPLFNKVQKYHYLTSSEAIPSFNLKFITIQHEKIPLCDF